MIILVESSKQAYLMSSISSLVSFINEHSFLY
nr:MAG TPA: hypothetical protein [Caudoviricetes sp.]DAZ75618.1 MAG TPA: hypothetical protein [Caudoviricetes sp.]